jgi:nucleotide-binding universal stress UspA family protein/YHS domain-containing protein
MKVLVPYDGSELSEQAAVMAIELLAQHRLDLLLLRVAADPEGATEAQASLYEATQRLATSPAAVTPLLTFGRPEQEIVRCADQHGADLIAMSTHGHSMLARMLVGSVTDRVIRTSPVPVLVMHPPTMSIDRVSPPAGRELRILAPIDGSQLAEEAVEMAASLLRPELIDLSLLAVQIYPEIDQDDAKRNLGRAAARLASRGIVTSTHLDRGDPSDQIARYTTDNGYDLIVMSTHGRGPLARMLVGSVTDRVVRTAEVPVLVIQPRLMETPFDPGSGEEIDPDKAAYSSEYHGRTFYFTSFEHKQQFDSAPEAYIGRRLDRPPIAIRGVRSRACDGPADGARGVAHPREHGTWAWRRDRSSSPPCAQSMRQGAGATGDTLTHRTCPGFRDRKEQFP